MSTLRTFAAIKFLLVIFMIPLFGSTSSAMEHLQKSLGQTVYAPVYSHIYVGAQGLEFQLAATLCVRNTSIDNPIKLESVGYYDSTGQLLRNLIKIPIKVGPLASSQYFIGESDTSGGFGAFFLVKWTSENKVTEPVVEVVTVGTRSGQGISFVSTGKVID